MKKRKVLFYVNTKKINKDVELTLFLNKLK